MPQVEFPGAPRARLGPVAGTALLSRILARLPNQRLSFTSRVRHPCGHARIPGTAYIPWIKLRSIRSLAASKSVIVSLSEPSMNRNVSLPAPPASVSSPVPP